MAKVFLSHASADRDHASQLHQWLIGEGHEVFLDQDLRDGIPVGEEWEQQLHARLCWADTVMCGHPGRCGIDVVLGRSRHRPIPRQSAVAGPS